MSCCGRDRFGGHVFRDFDRFDRDRFHRFRDIDCCFIERFDPRGDCCALEAKHRFQRQAI
jgi:hypothetical protein